MTTHTQPKIVMIADLVDPKDPQGRSYRQIQAAQNHTVPIGALVEFKTGERVRVFKHLRDCDETPIYVLGITDINLGGSFHRLGAYGEESFKVISTS